jgi:hypothetical protein
VLRPQAAAPQQLPTRRTQFGELNSARGVSQIDGLRVVQRNARDKRMDARGKPFELLTSILRQISR